MIILGAGVIALEMAQCFAAFGSHVTVLQRSKALFESKQGDPEAAKILQEELEKSGVHFMSGSTKQVETLRERTADPKDLPLLKLTIESDGANVDLECECLLVATGRVANIENLGLEEAGVEYELGKGIKCNDLAQSVSNPNVYGVGDCVADVPVSRCVFVPIFLSAFTLVSDAAASGVVGPIIAGE
jgi:pyruvate/2-oxoglutarate dehydrogenase complex dihydrolipoamide dehydrogenase (E3) component